MAIKMPIDASCEALLLDFCTYSGWLRKEPVMKIFGWRKIYCVISDRCFYYFKNETSKKAGRKFPLYGFNKVKRNLDNKSNKWSFILEHVNPNAKSYIFAASSQQEMVEWMKHIKEEMLRANNREPRTTADGSSDGSIPKLEGNSLERIEEKIYDDISSCKLDDIPSYYDNDNSDSDSDDQDQKRFSKPKVGIKVLSTTSAMRHKSGVEEHQVQQFRLPNLPKRKPGEGRPQRPDGYEDVKVLAGPAERGPPVHKKKDYWKSIHFDGDKDEATKRIDDIAKDGVFLVRKSDDPLAPLALVVYSKSHNKTKKFKIHKSQTEDSVASYYMKKELEFESLEELIYHYFYNSISGDQPLTLKEPYLLAEQP